MPCPVFSKVFGKCGRSAVRASDHRKYLGSSARLSTGFWDRRPRAKNRTTVTVFFSIVTVTSRNRRARVMYRHRVQGRRLQVQEEPVLKEVAAQDERPCRTFNFFFVKLFCIYVYVKFSRKLYYLNRVAGGRE